MVAAVVEVKFVAMGTVDAAVAAAGGVGDVIGGTTGAASSLLSAEVLIGTTPSISYPPLSST